MHSFPRKKQALSRRADYVYAPSEMQNTPRRVFITHGAQYARAGKRHVHRAHLRARGLAKGCGMYATLSTLPKAILEGDNWRRKST
jgi:hypothetical protein